VVSWFYVAHRLPLEGGVRRHRAHRDALPNKVPGQHQVDTPGAVRSRLRNTLLPKFSGPCRHVRRAPHEPLISGCHSAEAIAGSAIDAYIGTNRRGWHLGEDDDAKGSRADAPAAYEGLVSACGKKRGYRDRGERPQHPLPFVDGPSARPMFAVLATVCGAFTRWGLRPTARAIDQFDGTAYRSVPTFGLDRSSAGSCDRPAAEVVQIRVNLSVRPRACVAMGALSPPVLRRGRRPGHDRARCGKGLVTTVRAGSAGRGSARTQSRTWHLGWGWGCKRQARRSQSPAESAPCAPPIR
jgi:hypothetical protein